MKLEIERKFMVRGTGWQTTGPRHMEQGYLARTPGVSIRVRKSAPHAWLSVKATRQGITREEFEYAIPVPDADALLTLCGGHRVEKRRHVIRHEGDVWEVDEFLGANTGLVVAEIELEDPQQPFVRPPWVGREVTDDARYYNANLAQTPFTAWR